jgi:uncharacterized protein YjbI with pentapeptide repeats
VQRLVLVISLALLTLSLQAHGGAVAVPLSMDKKCSVPADGQWTQQEKFIWSRVCIGAVADFNNQVRYGGSLDPRTSQKWPNSRIVRPAFLATILFKDTYRRAITRYGVRIVGARFTETLDLHNAELVHELWIDRSLLEKGADLSGLKSSRRITFDSSRFKGNFDVLGADISGGLDMRGSQFDTASFDQSHIRGSVHLTGALVSGAATMAEMQVDTDLYMDGRATFGSVNLSSARIGGSLVLNGSTFMRPLFMNGIEIGGYLSMYGKEVADFMDVNLANAHINHSFVIEGARIGGTLNMVGTQVDEVFVISSHARITGISLYIAQIGG